MTQITPLAFWLGISEANRSHPPLLSVPTTTHTPEQTEQCRAAAALEMAMKQKFSQKDHMRQAKVVKQNEGDVVTEREMMRGVVNSKLLSSDFSLRKVFNMTMAHQLDPPKCAASDDDLAFACVKWRNLAKDFRNTALLTILPNDARMISFTQAKHIRARVNDDVSLLGLAIHEDIGAYLPSGPQSEERERFSKEYVLGYIMQFANYYSGRLNTISVTPSGQVNWGTDFEWFTVTAVPGQPGAFVIRFIGGQQIDMPDEVKGAGTGEWTITHNMDFNRSTLARKGYDRRMTQIFRDAGHALVGPKTRNCPDWLIKAQESKKAGNNVVPNENSPPSMSSGTASIPVPAVNPAPGAAQDENDDDDDDEEM
jgi:hypothetical protein